MDRSLTRYSRSKMVGNIFTSHNTWQFHIKNILAQILRTLYVLIFFDFLSKFFFAFDTNIMYWFEKKCWINSKYCLSNTNRHFNHIVQIKGRVRATIFKPAETVHVILFYYLADAIRCVVSADGRSQSPYSANDMESFFSYHFYMLLSRIVDVV